MPTSKPAPFPRRPRPHFSRSRAGCLTCRSRRKKCDEAKPICGGCDRGKRTCQWPDDAANPVSADGIPEVQDEERGQYYPSMSLPNVISPKTPPPVPGIVPERVSQRSPGDITVPVPPVPVLIHSGAIPSVQSLTHGSNSMGFPPRPVSLSSPRRPQTPPPVAGIIPERVSTRTPEENVYEPRRFPSATLSSPTGPIMSSGPQIPVQTASYHAVAMQSSSPPHARYPHTGVHLPVSVPISTAPIAVAPAPIAVPMPRHHLQTQTTAHSHIDIPAATQPLSISPVLLSEILSIDASQVPLNRMVTTSGVTANVTAPVISLGHSTVTTVPLASTNNLSPEPILGLPPYVMESPVPIGPTIPDTTSGYEPVNDASIPGHGNFITPGIEANRNAVSEPFGKVCDPVIYPHRVSGLVDNTASVEVSQPQFPQRGFVCQVDDDWQPSMSFPQSPQNSRPPHTRPPTPIRISGYANISPDQDSAIALSPQSTRSTAPAERQLLNSEPSSNPMTEAEFSKMLMRFVISKQAEMELDYDVDCDMDLSEIQHAEDNKIVTADEATRLRLRRARLKGKRTLEEQADLYNSQLYQAASATSAARKKAIYQEGQRMFSKIFRSRPVTVPHATQSFKLDPRSHLLFKHYLDTVADQLVTCTEDNNPFRRLIIPLAAQDDIIMHAMLAAGGAYFSFPESPDKELGTVSRYHYSIVLNRLHSALQLGKYMGESERISLVSVMLLLSLFETLAGSKYGTFLMHMTACRSVLLSLISNPPKDPMSDIGTMFGFLCECYCYSGTLAAVSSLLCYGKTAIEIDPFMRDLSHLRRFPTHRFFLGVSHSLFQMLTDIVDLGMDRFAEEAKGEASIEVFARYQNLLKRIETWVDPDDDGNMRMDWRNASCVYQHTMIILLHSIYYHDLFSEPLVIADVRERIETAFPLLLSVALSSNVGMMMMFPCMVFASCTEHDWLRDTLRYGIMAAKFRSCSMKQGLLIMETMWADPTPESFGPRGLGYIMNKHNIIFCMT